MPGFKPQRGEIFAKEKALELQFSKGDEVNTGARGDIGTKGLSDEETKRLCHSGLRIRRSLPLGDDMAYVGDNRVLELFKKFLNFLFENWKITSYNHPYNISRD